MKSKSNSSREDLRRKAVELLKIKPVKSIEKLSKVAIQEHIYELEVSRLELELKVEELEQQAEEQIQQKRKQKDSSCQKVPSEISKDKHIDIEINNIETRLYNIVQTIPDLIWLKNINGVYLMCNKIFERFFGATEDEIVGKTDYDFVDKELADFFIERDRIAMDAGKSTSNEEWITFADDGHSIFLETIKTPIFNNKGEIIGVLGVGRDITERKKTEDNLREKEVQYNNLANSGLALVWTSGKDKLCYYFNDTWLKFTGRTLEQELGNGWAEGVHPDDFDQCLETYVTAFDKQKSFEMEYRLRHVSGEYRWILDLGTPNYNRTGEFIGYIGNCFDISERKNIELALQKSEDKFKKAFTTSPDSININRLEDGMFVSINEGFTQIMGYAEEDVIGKTSREKNIWVNFEERDKLITAIQRYGFIENLVAQFRTKNGECIYGMMSAKIIELDGIRHILSITRDVTARKNAEDALRESEERFRNFFENSVVGKSITSTDGSLLVNNAFCKIVGYSKDELSLMKWQEMTYPDDVEFNLKVVDSILKGEKVSERWEKRFIHKNGDIVWADISTTLQRDNAGNPLYFITAINDITERKRTEDALRQSEELLSLYIKNSPIYSYIKEVNETESKVLFASENFKDMIGIAGSDMIGKPMYELFPTELAIKMTADDWSVHETNEILTIDETLNDRNYITIKFPIKQGDRNLLAGFTIDITERKQLEDALRKSEEEYRNLIEMSPMAICIIRNWETIYFNPSAVNLYGAKNEQELLNRHIFELIHPDYHEMVTENAKTLAENGFVKMQEQKYIKLDGSFLDVESQAKSIQYNGEKATLVVINDITERKKAEHELLKAKEEAERSQIYLENIINNIGDPLFVKDEQSRLLLVNDAFCGIFGLSKDLIMGKTLAENVTPDERESFLKIDKQVLADGFENVNEESLTVEGAQARTISTKKTRFIDRNDNKFLIGIIRDITEAKKAEHALQLSEENFRAIFEINSAPIAIIEADTTISMANEAYCKLSGYTHDELIGMSWTAQIPPEDLERLKEYNHLRFTNAKDAPDRYEFSFWRKDGEVRNALISVALIEDSKKIITSFIDITERKKAEQELKRSEAAFKRQNELFDSLIKNLPMGVFMVEAPSGKPLIANDAALTLLGRGVLPDTTRQNLADVYKAFKNNTNNPYPVDEMPIVRGMMGEHVHIDDMVVVRPDGTQTLLEIFGSPVKNDNGEIWASLVSFADITERKKVEEALKESERLLRESQEVAGLGSYAWDLQCGLWTSSKILDSIFGIEETYIRSLDGWIAIIQPDWRETMQNYVVNDVLTAGNRFDKEYKVVNQKDGSERWVHGLGQLEFDNENQPHKLIGTIQDITERKQAEEALRENELKYRTLFDSADDAILLFADGVWTECNESAMRVFDCSKEQIIGGHPIKFSPLFQPDGKSSEIESIKNIKLTLEGKPQVFEWEHCRLNGTPFAAEVALNRLELDGKTFIQAIVRDVSIRKQAQNALRESEAKLSTLFASMTEMVVMHEVVFDEFGNAVNYKIIDCNNTFTVVTGIKKEDAIGRLANEVYGEETAPYLYEFTQVGITGKSYEMNTYYAPMEKYFLISVVSSGKNQFSTITTDITAIQQIHEVIKEKNKELESYIYVASHDLRSPLVNIQGFSQRLQKQTDEIISVLNESQLEMQIKEHLNKITTEGIPKTLDFILSNVSKMDMLINGLLQLSRTGRIVMTVKQIDMNRLIETIISTYNFQISELGVKVHIEALPDCYGDENQLNQLFSNIIGNAIKYRDKNKQLELEISAHSHYNNVIYSVADTGVGISPSNLVKIWDVFYRVDPTSAEAGDGLGLSLAKRIVDKHKGKIWAESELGKGSVFYVSLHKTEFEE